MTRVDLLFLSHLNGIAVVGFIPQSCGHSKFDSKVQAMSPYKSTKPRTLTTRTRVPRLLRSQCASTLACS